MMRVTTNRKRSLILAVSLFLLPTILVGRIIEREWTFQQMFDKADLVVIANVVSTKDTDERTTILEKVNVVGVVTEFSRLLVLKGAKNTASFRLHHYRLQNKDDATLENGPDLVQIRSPKSTFLLFLVREKTGDYAPVTGQIDPASYSVLPVNNAAN